VNKKAPRLLAGLPIPAISSICAAMINAALIKCYFIAGLARPLVSVDYRVGQMANLVW